MCFLLLLAILFEIATMSEEEYLPSRLVQRKMEELGNKLNNLGKERLSFSSKVMGESYMKVPIVAYCFGNCAQSSSSV